MKKKQKHIEKAERINLLLRMVDLNVPLDACWVIAKALKKYGEKGGKFSVKNSVKITCKKDKLFNEENRHKKTIEQEPVKQEEKIKPKKDAKTTTKRKHTK